MFRHSFLSAAIGLATLALMTACASAPRHYEEGYTQKGLASWYGSGFDGQLTADGETFHKNEMTAAHRHLPFGSIVRVTNLDNGTSVEVRINDRGPYGDGDRIIDVSEAAADILKMKHAGLVPVEIELLSVGHSH